MTRAPLIVSFGVSDSRLQDTCWARKVVALARSARVTLMLLGDGGATDFNPTKIAMSLAPAAGSLAFVPTVNAGVDNPATVARSLVELCCSTAGDAGWQPSTLVQPHTAQSLSEGVEFVAATDEFWTGQKRPLLVQSDADPMWYRTGPDILVIDRDSPAPAPGPKVLLRIFTAMAGLDEIEKLYNSGIINGIHLTPPDIEEGLQALAHTMLPAMIARGMVKTGEVSGPLRSRLGIK